MSTLLVQSETFDNIADAIRAKTGKVASMTPLEMPEEIASISGGGGGNVERVGKYVEVVTNSIGGMNASIDLKYYEGDTLVETVRKVYTSVQGRANAYDFRGLVKLYYLGGTTSWAIEALYDVVYDDILYSKGDMITSWLYNVTVDYRIDKVLPLTYGNCIYDAGTFTSASTQHGIVDVVCGFKPDLIMVRMKLSNAGADTTSFWWCDESWAETKAIWDLVPQEMVSYLVDLERQSGETGIQAINNDGFSFMSNGGNTQGCTCNYVAVKFEPEDDLQFKTYAKFDGIGIQLPYTINSDYKVTVEFYETSYGSDSSVIGNDYSTGSYYSHLTKYNNNWYASQGTSDYLLTSWTGNMLHKFVNNNGSNQNVFDENITMPYTPTTQSSIYYMVGCRESLSSWGYAGYIKSYKIESISTGNKICELKPCLYKGKVACLYDTVNDRFYYANGLTVTDSIPT